MQRSVFTLFVMAQCSLLVCHLYEYHFIDEEKTWNEAQNYCRQHYTDLATVNNMTDMRRLLNSTNDPRGKEGWIGLQNQTRENRTWHWSMPGVEFSVSEAQWEEGEPNNMVGVENCAGWNEGQWKDFPCGDKKKFICYNETAHSWIEESKTWRQAQIYCREHHIDLISGHEQFEKLNDPDDDDWWIGLFRDSWRWSDGNTSSFRNWNQSFNDDGVNKTCATTLSDGNWTSDECDQKKPFFCYDDKVILIEQPMSWEDALNHCRKYHKDLVSITNRHQQSWVQERAKMANSSLVWLGLRYTCSMDLWFWVDDHLVCYENWGQKNQTDSCDMAAAMNTAGGYQWVEQTDTIQLPFICLKRKT